MTLDDRSLIWKLRSHGCEVDFLELKGKVFSDIKGLSEGSEIVRFYIGDKLAYVLVHLQECCESVYIEDVCGDINDIIGSEILMAEEASNNDGGRLSEYDKSYTWTFYKLATIKGYVTIRWYGTSNGYYGESATLWNVSKFSNLVNNENN